MTNAGGTTKAPTFTAGAPVNARRLVPVTSMSVVVLPPTALDGVKLVIFGATLKISVLAPVPTPFVMLTGPVTAPAGTTAFSDVAVTAVGVTGPAPLNVTPVAPVRFVPVIVTSAPTGPVAGANAIARGGCTTVRSVALSAVPSTVMMLILPVVAPNGTLN